MNTTAAATDANGTPDTVPVMTNLEAQRRCKAAFEDNAAFWTADGHPERALFWQAMANSCQEVIDGIQRTNDDDYIPF